MLVALDRPVPRRAPAEHARRRADRRLFAPPERARWLARRTAQLASLGGVSGRHDALGTDLTRGRPESWLVSTSRTCTTNACSARRSNGETSRRS
jgi:hypothetical protein